VKDQCLFKTPVLFERREMTQKRETNPSRPRKGTLQLVNQTGDPTLPNLVPGIRWEVEGKSVVSEVEEEPHNAQKTRKETFPRGRLSTGGGLCQHQTDYGICCRTKKKKKGGKVIGDQFGPKRKTIKIHT